MERRTALLLIGGSLSAGIAGCSSLSPGGEQMDNGETNGTESDGETGPGNPERVVENYFSAFSAGNLDGVLAVVHSESPVRSQIEQTNETEFESSVERYTITVDETSVVEQNGTSAIVNVTTTTEVQGQSQTETGRIELRTEDNQWKLWDLAPEEESDEPAVEPADVEVGEDPEAVYRRYFEAQSNGELAVVLGVSHSEGPTYADFSQWRKAEYEEVASQQTFTVEGTTIVEESEDAVVVQGTVVWEPEFAEKPNTLEPQIELRPEDGEWRIWDAPGAGE